MHEENDLRKNLNSINSVKDYMAKVEFKIPLNKLYEIKAECRDTDSGNFCAVLLHVVDDEIKALNENKSYLLQVWKRGGQLIFERPLTKSLWCWNMTSEKFVFQENRYRREIFLISLYMDQ